MRQIVSYYLLVLSLVSGFWLVYAIIATQLRNRQERCERENVLAARSELNHLRLSGLTAQQQLWTCDSDDHPEILDEGILGQIEQLQNEINQRVVQLEREL